MIPWPIDSGAVHRTDQMLRGLIDQGFAVDLLCLNQSEPQSTSASIAERLRKQYPKLRQVTVRRHPRFIRKWRLPETIGKLRYFAAIASDVLTWRANTINSAPHCPPNFARLVKDRLRRSSYDAVWFNYLRVMPRRLKTNTRVICDLHDYQTERIRRDVLPTLYPWRRGYYLRRYMRSEKAALNLCDQAVAISPVEASSICTEVKPRGNVICIPATDDLRPISEQSAEYDMLYVGSRSDANVAGIIWFLEKCFPEIVQELPLVRLLIQGTIINTPYLKGGTGTLRHGRNIVLSGPVASLASVYASARLVICPVLHGTGMKIKMVEAMAYGHAIIATRAAVEGIATDLGLQAYDTADEFSSACIETLKDSSLLAARIAASRATFDRDHAYSGLACKVASVFGV